MMVWADRQTDGQTSFQLYIYRCQPEQFTRPQRYIWSEKYCLVMVRDYNMCARINILTYRSLSAILRKKFNLCSTLL